MEWIIIVICILIGIHFSISIWRSGRERRALRDLQAIVMFGDPDAIDDFLDSYRSKCLSEYDYKLYREHARLIREYMDAVKNYKA